ncbi:MAG: T9SS C-terminal target domain-containing protein, partial [Planctomycetia bacterium]|nr:T9SS C-terminal target domain-containing protein [Planctomycetia bacterium]
MKKIALIIIILFMHSFNIAMAQAPTIEWQNTIGGSSADYLHAIHQTTDGGFILGGTSGSGISGDKTEPNQGRSDYWVIKLDETGNIIWQNTIGGSHSDNLHAIQQTTDGGYILGGTSESNISGDKTEPNQGN